MKTVWKYSVLILATLLALSLAIWGGVGLATRAATVTVNVSGAPWGVSTCYIGAVEGDTDYNINQMLDLGINSYRIYGGMSRWEYQDDDGVYGSPTIDQIKADPNVINWAWWDNVMTNPTCGSDYGSNWDGCPPAVWAGNARTIFQQAKDNNVRLVVTLRNVDNSNNPAWANTQMNPPNAPEDWNEWWEHVFATVYWANVRNDYHIDDWQVHNEPNNGSQGWAGTIEDYYLFAQYTADAIRYVYNTYLPGRTPHIYAPVSGGSWPRDVLINAGQYYDMEDMHNYDTDVSTRHQQANQWVIDYGGGAYPLVDSEWGSWHASQYDSLANAVKLLTENLIRMSKPNLDYVYMNHVFALYDWQTWGSGLIHGYSPNQTYTPGYYGMRNAIRALQGCKTTYQSTTSNTKLLAITTQDGSGNIYLLVSNNAPSAYQVDANLSALITSGVGTIYEFSSTRNDEVAGTVTLSNGHAVFNVPNGSVVVQFGGGSPPPTPTNTPTPAPPTNTPTPGPSATPTNTPLPPTATSTPGGATVMHVADIYTTDANGVPKTAFTKGEYVYWRVKIVDQGSSPVSGADVTCKIRRPDSSLWTSKTFATGADGWALFSLKSAPSNKTGVYTINVTNVVKAGATYDPGANVKSSCQFTLQ
jgi:hypothetical protein